MPTRAGEADPRARKLKAPTRAQPSSTSSRSAVRAPSWPRQPDRADRGMNEPTGGYASAYPSSRVSGRVSLDSFQPQSIRCVPPLPLAPASPHPVPGLS